MSISRLGASRPEGPVILVHGGAGRLPVERHAAAIAGVEAAARAGWSLLERGADAEAAVVAAVRVLEDDPTFNAGRGSCLNAAGGFEMDAAIMRSDDQRSGAVAAVPEVANAIELARAVMHESPHCLLVGPGAEAFARARNLGVFGRERVWTEKAEAAFRRAQAGGERHGRADTVGAIALDADGLLCVGCSTGGTLLKLPGRVGDTPLCGGGFYASPTLGASCATGLGEAILTRVASYEVLQRIATGLPPVAAASQVCDEVARWPASTCGLLVVTPDGRAGLAHRSENLSWALARAGEPIRSGVTADDFPAP